MARSLPTPIDDLATYDLETATLGQVADYFGLDRRAVAGLVKAGILVRKQRQPPASNKEFHIYTWSLRQFDNLRLKRSA